MVRWDNPRQQSAFVFVCLVVVGDKISEPPYLASPVNRSGDLDSDVSHHGSHYRPWTNSFARRFIVACWSRRVVVTSWSTSPISRTSAAPSIVACLDVRCVRTCPPARTTGNRTNNVQRSSAGTQAVPAATILGRTRLLAPPQIFRTLSTHLLRPSGRGGPAVSSVRSHSSARAASYRSPRHSRLLTRRARIVLRR